MRDTRRKIVISGVIDFPSQVIAHISRGGSRKFRQGWPGHMPAIQSEDSIKIIQNFKEKGVVAASSAHPPPKSALTDYDSGDIDYKE